MAITQEQKQEALKQISDKLEVAEKLIQEAKEIAETNHVSFSLREGPAGFQFNGNWGDWDDVDGLWVGSQC